jgi:hypothetical protein
MARSVYDMTPEEYERMKSHPAYADMESAAQDAYDLERDKLDMADSNADADRDAANARFEAEMAFRMKQLALEKKRLEIERGKAAADAWYQQQQVRLTEEAHMLKASEIGLDYLKTSVEYASTADNYFKQADFQAGMAQRQDVPLFMEALLNNVNSATAQQWGGKPEPNNLTELAQGMGYDGQTTGPGTEPWKPANQGKPFGGVIPGVKDPSAGKGGKKGKRGKGSRNQPQPAPTPTPGQPAPSQPAPDPATANAQATAAAANQGAAGAPVPASVAAAAQRARRPGEADPNDPFVIRNNLQGWQEQDVGALRGADAIASRGLAKIGAQGIEKLGKSKGKLLFAGFKRLGYDTDAMLDDYTRSRFRQGSAAEA